jgi:hypothetical protein
MLELLTHARLLDNPHAGSEILHPGSAGMGTQQNAPVTPQLASGVLGLGH